MSFQIQPESPSVSRAHTPDSCAISLLASSAHSGANDLAELLLLTAALSEHLTNLRSIIGLCLLVTVSCKCVTLPLTSGQQQVSIDRALQG